MSTPMAALNSASITHGEFVRLTTSSATYTFCNAAAPVVADGISFTGLGSLLSVGDVQRDLKATSDDMLITLIGIDPTNVALVLANNIKGSTVEIWRGFFDSNYQIITSPTTQFFKRYQGIVNSVSLNETFDENNRSRTVACSIACASFRTILENKISGIRTNQNTWRALYSTDASMDRVDAIAGQYFDFGSPPKGGGLSDPNGEAAEPWWNQVQETGL